MTNYGAAMLACCFFFLLYGRGTAQNTPDAYIDSLNELAWQLRDGDPVRALTYAREARELADSSGYAMGKCEAYSKEGVILKNVGLYKEALARYLDALNCLPETEEASLAALYNNIANVYERFDSVGIAIDYYKKSLSIRSAMKDTLGTASVHNNLGIAYRGEGQDSLALDSYLASLDNYSKARDSCGMGMVYHNIGSLYLYLRNEEDINLDRVKYYYDLSLPLRKKHCSEMSLAGLYLAMGAWAFYDGQYQLAIDSFHSKSLKIGLGGGNYNLIKEAHFNIAESYKALGKTDSAYAHLAKYLGMQDTISSRGSGQRFEVLHTLYEVRAKEQENQLLVAKNRQKTISLYGTGIGAALLLLLAGVIIFNRQQKLKANKELARKEGEINRRKMTHLLKQQELNTIIAMMDGQEKERKRVAEDLHDRLGGMLATVKLQFTSLGPGLSKDHPERKTLYEKAIHLLDGTVEEVRKIAHNMVSGVLTKFGLVPALEEMQQTILETGQLEVELDTFGLDNRLENSLEVLVFRIVQEMVTNTIKHARATNITIQLIHRNNLLNIIFEDNGGGFDTSVLKNASGMGLKNIHAKVENLDGLMEIDSRKGRGTTINIQLPVKKTNNHEIKSYKSISGR